MRRWLCFTVFLGLLGALFSVAPASAADVCDGGFSARLRCFSGWLGDGTVTVRLNRELALDAAPDRDALVAAVREGRDSLAVQVPAKVTTGAGGTVLLVLAGHRFVHPDARITRLDAATVRELTRLRLCDTGNARALCDTLQDTPGKHELAGRDLALQPDVAVLGKQRTVAVGPPPFADSPSPSPKETKKEAAQPSGPDPMTILVTVMSVLLALLLAALVLLIRRSRPVAVAVPATGVQQTERTTRLRVTPPRTHGRPAPAPRRGPTRPAVVRTDLHPQGYVELDRVLYRALWAEPGQAPPSPGSRVEVTDGPEPDSDVLYAFPPAVGRHAHAHAR